MSHSISKIKHHIIDIPGEVDQEWPCKSSTKDLYLNSLPQKKWPKISIVTPSFNQGNYLEKTLKSVLLQEYPNLEYIIIDGGSTDQSVKIIEKYDKWISYWVSERDKGQSHAINKGMKIATGELLGWLNSDDYLLPGALFKLAQTYLECSSVGVIYGQGHIIDKYGNIIYTPNLVQVTHESLFKWCYGNDFMQPSCLFTKKSWNDCGPLDENIHFALDVDLWLKISKKYSFKKIDDVLSVSLSHTEAKTTAYRNRMLVDLAIVIMKHGGEPQTREILNEIADKLSDAEKKLYTLSKLPFAGYINWLIDKINKLSH